MQSSCDNAYIWGVEKTKYSSRLDHAGMTASILCAIHCAIVPLLITLLPLAGLGFLANPLGWMEYDNFCAVRRLLCYWIVLFQDSSPAITGAGINCGLFGHHCRAHLGTWLARSHNSADWRLAYSNSSFYKLPLRAQLHKTLTPPIKSRVPGYPGH